jgi:metal-dependent hydrolase (beta-lactamase superfamily II)
MSGARPETVLKNARELGADLAGVQDVILSHNHGDHTGGLLHLRRELVRENPAALSRVGSHVATSSMRLRTTFKIKKPAGNRAQTTRRRAVIKCPVNWQRRAGARAGRLYRNAAGSLRR